MSMEFDFFDPDCFPIVHCLYQLKREPKIKVLVLHDEAKLLEEEDDKMRCYVVCRRYFDDFTRRHTCTFDVAQDEDIELHPLKTFLEEFEPYKVEGE